MRKTGLRIGLESANDKIPVFNDFIRRMLLLAAGRILFRQMRQDLYLVFLIAVLSFVARPRISNRAINVFGEAALALLIKQAIGHHVIRCNEQSIGRDQETGTEISSSQFTVHLVFNDDL